MFDPMLLSHWLSGRLLFICALLRLPTVWPTNGYWLSKQPPANIFYCYRDNIIWYQMAWTYRWIVTIKTFRSPLMNAYFHILCPEIEVNKIIGSVWKPTEYAVPKTYSLYLENMALFKEHHIRFGFVWCFHQTYLNWTFHCSHVEAMKSNTTHHLFAL